MARENTQAYRRAPERPVLLRCMPLVRWHVSTVLFPVPADLYGHGATARGTFGTLTFAHSITSRRLSGVEP